MNLGEGEAGREESGEKRTRKLTYTKGQKTVARGKGHLSGKGKGEYKYGVLVCGGGGGRGAVNG